MTAARTPRRTTEPFREEHVAIKEHLRHMSQMIQSIPGGVPEAQKQSMTQLVEALTGHILPHAEWEEKVLLTVLDETMTPEEFEREITSQGHPHSH